MGFLQTTVCKNDIVFYVQLVYNCTHMNLYLKFERDLIDVTLCKTA